MLTQHPRANLPQDSRERDRAGLFELPHDQGDAAGRIRRGGSGLLLGPDRQPDDIAGISVFGEPRERHITGAVPVDGGVSTIR